MRRQQELATNHARRFAVFAASLGLALGLFVALSTLLPGVRAGQADADVAIQNFAFRPPLITVTVNSTVHWANADSFQHTTTSSDGLWDSGPLGASGVFTHTFPAVGTFAYFCVIHEFMRGTVVVVPALDRQLFLPLVRM